jgi:hypothetical protein
MPPVKSKETLTLSFLHHVKDVQYTLQCEWSLNQVEKAYREHQFTDLLDLIYRQVWAAQKRHFMFMYLLFASPDPRLRPTFPHFLESLLSSSPINSSNDPRGRSAEGLIPQSLDFDVELWDALTFSSLPAASDFFLTDFGISAFIQAMTTVKDQVMYDLLARAPFVSPLFIRFLNTVFWPVLAVATEIDGLASKIEARWIQHLDQIPAVVVRFLKEAKDPAYLLWTACFQFAVTPDTACLYGLVGFSQRLSGAVTCHLRDILAFRGRRSILKRLVEPILRLKGSGIPTITVNHRDDVPTLFDLVLLSDLDFNVHASLALGGFLVHPQEYSVGLYHRPSDANRDALVYRPDGTMAGGARAAAHLRHLLQAADALPNFQSVPAGLTIQKFFTEYLEDRGDPDTDSLRTSAVRFLTRRALTEGDVSGLLQDVTMTRTLEIRVLSVFTEIQGVLTTVQELSQAVSEQVERAFYMSLLKPFWRAHESLRPNFAEICARPEGLVTSFNAVRADLAKLDSPLAACAFPCVLIYGFLSQNFKFEEFRRARPNLKKLDERVRTGIADPEPVIEVQFAGSGGAKGAWLRKRLMEMKAEEDILDFVRVACDASVPLEKLRAFLLAFGMARMFFIQDAGPKNELGADEFTPMLICYVVIANPNAIVSNLAYLADLCGNPEFEVLFDEATEPMVILRSVVTQALPGVNLGTICSNISC